MATRSVLASLLLILLTACGGDEQAPDAATAPPAAAASDQATSGAPPNAVAGATAAAGAPAAVATPEAAARPELPAACAALIENYERCIENHLPESGRDLLREALEQSRIHWNQAAADATTEETQRQLAAACEQSKIELQTQMSGYGCIL